MPKPGEKIIVIRVNQENRTCTITTEDGKMLEFESVAVFAGDATANRVFIRMHGASADSAWAYGQGYKVAFTAGNEGMKAFRSFYKQSAAHVCNIINPEQFRQEAGAEEILNKWESNDQTKWGGWDSEDVLEDKQRSEARKKALLDRRLTGKEPDDSDDGPTFH